MSSNSIFSGLSDDELQELNRFLNVESEKQRLRKSGYETSSDKVTDMPAVNDFIEGFKSPFRAIGDFFDPNTDEEIAKLALEKEALEKDRAIMNENYKDYYGDGAVGGLFSDFLTAVPASAGSMVPAVGVSALTGGLGLGATATRVAASTAMGASEGLGQYADSLASNEDRGTAFKRGLIAGGISAGMGYVGGLAADRVGVLLAGSEPLRRYAVNKIGGKAGSFLTDTAFEIGEEFGIAKFANDQDFTGRDFAITALMSSLMKGGIHGIDAVRNSLFTDLSPDTSLGANFINNYKAYKNSGSEYKTKIDGMDDLVKAFAYVDKLSEGLKLKPEEFNEMQNSEFFKLISKERSKNFGKVGKALTKIFGADFTDAKLEAELDSFNRVFSGPLNKLENGRTVTELDFINSLNEKIKTLEVELKNQEESLASAEQKKAALDEAFAKNISKAPDLLEYNPTENRDTNYLSLGDAVDSARSLSEQDKAVNKVETSTDVSGSDTSSAVQKLISDPKLSNEEKLALIEDELSKVEERYETVSEIKKSKKLVSEKTEKTVMEKEFYQDTEIEERFIPISQKVDAGRNKTIVADRLKNNKDALNVSDEELVALKRDHKNSSPFELFESLFESFKGMQNKHFTPSEKSKSYRSFEILKSFIDSSLNRGQGIMLANVPFSDTEFDADFFNSKTEKIFDGDSSKFYKNLFGKDKKKVTKLELTNLLSDRVESFNKLFKETSEGRSTPENLGNLFNEFLTLYNLRNLIMNGGKSFDFSNLSEKNLEGSFPLLKKKSFEKLFGLNADTLASNKVTNQAKNFKNDSYDPLGESIVDKSKDSDLFYERAESGNPNTYVITTGKGKPNVTLEAAKNNLDAALKSIKADYSDKNYRDGFKNIYGHLEEFLYAFAQGKKKDLKDFEFIKSLMYYFTTNGNSPYIINIPRSDKITVPNKKVTDLLQTLKPLTITDVVKKMKQFYPDLDKGLTSEALSFFNNFEKEAVFIPSNKSLSVGEFNRALSDAFENSFYVKVFRELLKGVKPNEKIDFDSFNLDSNKHKKFDMAQIVEAFSLKPAEGFSNNSPEYIGEDKRVSKSSGFFSSVSPKDTSPTNKVPRVVSQEVTIDPDAIKGINNFNPLDSEYDKNLYEKYSKMDVSNLKTTRNTATRTHNSKSNNLEERLKPDSKNPFKTEQQKLNALKGVRETARKIQIISAFIKADGVLENLDFTRVHPIEWVHDSSYMFSDGKLKDPTLSAKELAEFHSNRKKYIISEIEKLKKAKTKKGSKADRLNAEKIDSLVSELKFLNNNTMLDTYKRVEVPRKVTKVREVPVTREVTVEKEVEVEDIIVKYKPFDLADKGLEGLVSESIDVAENIRNIRKTIADVKGDIANFKADYEDKKALVDKFNQMLFTNEHVSYFSFNPEKDDYSVVKSDDLVAKELKPILAGDLGFTDEVIKNSIVPKFLKHHQALKNYLRYLRDFTARSKYNTIKEAQPVFDVSVKGKAALSNLAKNNVVTHIKDMADDFIFKNYDGDESVVNHKNAVLSLVIKNMNSILNTFVPVIPVSKTDTKGIKIARVVEGSRLSAFNLSNKHKAERSELLKKLIPLSMEKTKEINALKEKISKMKNGFSRQLYQKRLTTAFQEMKELWQPYKEFGDRVIAEGDTPRPKDSQGKYIAGYGVENKTARKRPRQTRPSAKSLQNLKTLSNVIAENENFLSGLNEKLAIAEQTESALIASINNRQSEYVKDLKKEQEMLATAISAVITNDLGKTLNSGDANITSGSDTDISSFDTMLQQIGYLRTNYIANIAEMKAEISSLRETIAELKSELLKEGFTSEDFKRISVAIDSVNYEKFNASLENLASIKEHVSEVYRQFEIEDPAIEKERARRKLEADRKNKSANPKNDTPKSNKPKNESPKTPETELTEEQKFENFKKTLSKKPKSSKLSDEEYAKEQYKLKKLADKKAEAKKKQKELDRKKMQEENKKKYNASKNVSGKKN